MCAKLIFRYIRHNTKSAPAWPIIFYVSFPLQENWLGQDGSALPRRGRLGVDKGGDCKYAVQLIHVQKGERDITREQNSADLCPERPSPNYSGYPS